MAPITFSRPNKLFLLMFLLTMIMYLAAGQRLRETNMVFYLQDLASGPNATVVPVTGIPGKLWSFTSLGTIFCVDDPITETPDRKSTPVGRAQGMFVTSALDGSNVQVYISIIFTNLEYNGSTLEIQGTSRQFDKYREVAVVSGTGRFRFVRGYAVFETIYFDRTILYSIVRCTITLLHF